MSPRKRRHDRFSTATPASECRICQSRLLFAIVRSQIRNRCGGQQPFLLAPKNKDGEEAAMPGQPVALSRVSGSFPPAIHSRKSPAAAGLAAIIRSSQELSRFAEPTFTDFVAPGNIKTRRPCEEAVDDDTSLWKAEENSDGIYF